jgi:hypothetical protein
VSDISEDPTRDGHLPSVGYGRPPQQYRFEKGRSGNPRGRSSEKRNLYHSLQEMLEAKVLGKNERTMPGDEIIAARIIEGALKGHSLAFRKFVDLARRAKLFDDLSGAPKLSASMDPEVDLRAEVEKLRAKLKKYGDFDWAEEATEAKDD